MENNQMRNMQSFEQSSNSTYIQAQQQQQNTLILTAPITFASRPITNKPNEMSYYTERERPMMLNTWTQTTNTDLGINGNTNEYFEMIVQDFKEKEKALLEKIRTLETDLHVKSELISQMQTVYEPKANENEPKQKRRQRPRQPNAAKLTKMLLQQHHNQFGAVPTSTTATHMSASYNNYSGTSSSSPDSNISIQCEQQRIQQNSHTQSHTILNSNTLHDTQPCKLNYTIISDGGCNSGGEPIEIEIAAEEEVAHSCNQSVDSDRLEICIAEEASYLPNDLSSTSKPLDSTKVFTHEQKPLQPLSTNSASTSRISLLRQPSVATNDAPIVAVAAATSTCNWNDNPNTVAIGPNNTRIPTEIFDAIDWEEPSAATRTLLLTLFDRHTLATHSMTGRPSPAFKNANKPIKEGLDPSKIQDIVFAITKRSQVPEKVVRNFITTKCADETKMMKLARAKMDQDKENVNRGRR